MAKIKKKSGDSPPPKETKGSKGHKGHHESPSKDPAELFASYGNKYLAAAFPVGDERLKRSKPLDIVFAFDTTGSMYKYLEVVSEQIAALTERIASVIEGARIGLVAFGDHCDEKTTYLTKVLPLTPNLERIGPFLGSVERTHGGDEPEAVEDALWEVNDLNWRLSSIRAVVLIGDAPPHGVIDSKSVCTNRKDYELETHALASKGIRLYAVQCGGQDATTKVFEWMAKMTDGLRLDLDNADDLVDLLIGVCMKEVGMLDEFSEELAERHGLSESKDKLFKMLAEKN